MNKIIEKLSICKIRIIDIDLFHQKERKLFSDRSESDVGYSRIKINLLYRKKDIKMNFYKIIS